jgi:2',3'-cyclic-nucleotide 2'-phosphodiesterase/3'-nucleotidase
VNPDANRIVNLSYNGEPVSDDQIFLVVSNNYRAGGGGNFPGITGDKIVVDAPDANRDVLANYIIDQEVINPAPDMNWKFSPINDTVAISFLTSPSESAMTYAEEFPNITCDEEVNSDGYAVCTLDMSE